MDEPLEVDRRSEVVRVELCFGNARLLVSRREDCLNRVRFSAAMGAPDDLAPRSLYDQGASRAATMKPVESMVVRLP